MRSTKRTHTLRLRPAPRWSLSQTWRPRALCRRHFPRATLTETDRKRSRLAVFRRTLTERAVHLPADGMMTWPLHHGFAATPEHGSGMLGSPLGSGCMITLVRRG